MTYQRQFLTVYIKRLAKMAEIDEKVTICEHRGGEVKEIRVEKYALISTHTARRSFATHLQRSKVPLSSISMALGHKKVTTTMRYLRLGVDENAAILAGSSFFHNLVPRTGIEPARLAAHAPETCASTYSATWAFGNCGVQK